MANKPKQVGLDTPHIYGSGLQKLQHGDRAIFFGTTRDSEGKAAHKDPIKIVQLYKDGAVIAKNLRNGKYFNTNTKFVLKENPFSVNEQVKRKIQLTSDLEKFNRDIMLGRKLTSYPKFKEQDIAEDNFYIAYSFWHIAKKILKTNKDYINDKIFIEFLDQITRALEAVGDDIGGYNSSHFDELIGNLQNNMEETIEEIDTLMEAVSNAVLDLDEKEYDDDKDDLNEQFDTLQLRANVWVNVKDLGKRWIELVDYTGQNPDNETGHLAAFIKTKPAAKEDGQWVSYMDLNYQYPEMEDDVTKDNKELTNIMKETKKKLNTFDKKEKHGSTPEYFFKKFNKGNSRSKDNPEDVTDYVNKSFRPATDKFGKPKEFGQTREEGKDWKGSEMEPAGQFGPPTLGSNKDTSLTNLMPHKELNDMEACPKCKSNEVDGEDDIMDMKKCQNCGHQFTRGDLKEGKISGSLKKWADAAKELAKTIFADKTWNKLSDEEQNVSYSESDKRKKKKKAEGPLKMKNDGSINFEENED